MSNRYKVNRKKQTVDKQCGETREWKHYKTFDELTKREQRKVSKYWIYNLR